jgi:hypothetical protein
MQPDNRLLLPIDSSDGERVPLQYFPTCAPSGESLRSIRVVAQQAQALQSDVISCAVYDCLLRKDADFSIFKK